MTLNQKRIWQIINSNIFLWLLGALVLTLFPFIWHQWIHSQERKERIVKIDNEINNRINQMINIFYRQIDSSKGSANNEASINPKRILLDFKDSPKETSINTNKDSSHHYKSYASYKQFEDYSTITLLNELITLENNNKQKDSLKTILSIISSKDFVPFKEKIQLNDIPLIIQKLKDSLYLERWKN